MWHGSCITIGQRRTKPRQEKRTMTEITTEITKSTTRDDITSHLDGIGVEYLLGHEQDEVRIETAAAGLIVVYRHAAHEGAGVANLWAWCTTGPEGDQDTGGLDSFEELTGLCGLVASRYQPSAADIAVQLEGADVGPGELTLDLLREHMGDTAHLATAELLDDVADKMGFRIDADAYGNAYYAS
jgi:hypothetical protein